MKVWDQQASFRAVRERAVRERSGNASPLTSLTRGSLYPPEPPVTPTPGGLPPPVTAPPVTPTPGGLPPPVTAPPVTPVAWTPSIIASTSVTWGIVGDTSKKNIVYVRTRTSGNVLAARGTEGETSMGWRVMNRCHDPTNKLLLVPTTATRAKQHWILDKKQSQSKVLCWTRAGKVMKWVPLPMTTRRTTVLRRADNRVSDVSPGLSPPLRKRQKYNHEGIRAGENHGCKCRLGDVCVKARLKAREEGELPMGEPRISQLPSTAPVRMNC